MSPVVTTTAATDRKLAVRLPNWVGDVCMALPALDLLIRNGFTLHALGKGWAGDLLAGLPLTVGKLPKGLGATAAAWRATGCRDGVLFTNSFGSALQMWWGGVRATGYRKEFRSPFLGQGIPRVDRIHEVDSYWRLAVAVLERHGLRAPVVIPHVPLPLTATHRQTADEALKRAGVTGSFVVLCPLAVGTIAGRSKQWPSFPLLCRGLIEQGIRVVACPGPGEEQATAAALPGATLLPGLALGAYAAVLSRARRVVANDSGPMHLAAAVGVPVLGIFGLTEPGRTRPWSDLGQTVGDWNGWPSAQAVIAAYGKLADGAPPAG
jgi:heptosyltransferase II